MKCRSHRFRTNLDGLTLKVEGTQAASPLTYVTVIFCERCGLVAHESNASETRRRQIEARMAEAA